MKTSRLIAAAAIGLSSLFGSAHAAVCGGVTGSLEVFGGPITVPDLGCSGTSFYWVDAYGVDGLGDFNGGNPHRLTATVTDTSIRLEMRFGDYAQFLDDLFWTFTLGAGKSFGAIVETSDSFKADQDIAGSVEFGNAELLNFVPGDTASFRIVGAGHAYSTETTFVAEYSVRTTDTPLSVPEPSSLMLVAGALGALAISRRRKVDACA